MPWNDLKSEILRQPGWDAIDAHGREFDGLLIATYLLSRRYRILRI